MNWIDDVREFVKPRPDRRRLTEPVPVDADDVTPQTEDEKLAELQRRYGDGPGVSA